MTANLSAMPCSGRFYVLGPTVETALEVARLVECVMRQTTDMRAAAFDVHDVEGPVRYDSSWVPGGRRRELRHGLGVADLWTGLVSWPDASSARYFSVIVMDHHYLKTCKRASEPFTELRNFRRRGSAS